MNNIQQFASELSDWSDIALKNQTAIDKTYALKEKIDNLLLALIKEKDEAKNNNTKEYDLCIKKVMEEYTYCFMLIIDSARTFGIDINKLIRESQKKLEVNKWLKQNQNNLIKHTK